MLIEDDMSYKIITKPDALQWYNHVLQGGDIMSEIKISDSDNELTVGNSFDATIQQLVTDIIRLRDTYKKIDGKFPSGTNLEFELGKLIFVVLEKIHPIILTDTNFWRWFTISHRDLLDIAAWRHGNSLDTLGDFDKSNLGIGNIKEGFYSRCWMRVALAYDVNQRDPFIFAQQGDQDFWRSHILRQSYAKSSNMIRALIRFQYPNLDNVAQLRPSGDHPLGIRKIARNLSASLSTIAIDALDDESALKFIEATYEKMQYEANNITK